MSQPVAYNSPIKACTVCREVRNFDLLIEDMEDIFGESWGELSFLETLGFLASPDSADLELLAVALDDDDEPQINIIRKIIEQAAGRGVRVLLIAEALSPIVLHQMLRAGAEDFVPYPLPESALKDTIERMRRAQSTPARATMPAPAGNTFGALFAVQSLSGGAGGTNFAVNLAWELLAAHRPHGKSVCLIDLDFQRGSVSTYLDLPRTERVYELLSQTATMDDASFTATLQKFQEKLHVLTAPSDMLPLDLLSPTEIERILAVARSNFDVVIIDMPGSVVQWTETVLSAADAYFTLMELDMRSAQNALRLIRALKADSLPMENVRFILNRAPRFTDFTGKSRAKRLAESLAIEFCAFLPDGGTQVREANDHGLPLSEYAARNPLVKELRRFAAELPIAPITDKIAAE